MSLVTPVPLISAPSPGSGASITLRIAAVLVGLATVLPSPTPRLLLVGLGLEISPGLLGFCSLCALLVLLGLISTCIRVSLLATCWTRAEVSRLLRLCGPGPIAELAFPCDHLGRGKHKRTREGTAVMTSNELGLGLGGRVGPESAPSAAAGCAEAPMPRRRGRRGGGLWGPLSASSAYTPTGGGGRSSSRRTANRGSRGGQNALGTSATKV